MACTSCTSGGGCSTGSQCNSNGGCASGGCNKLNTYDWLAGMALGMQEVFPYLEVRFKGTRKEFVKNDPYTQLYTGDAVLVDFNGNTDLGFVSLQGELVRIQMKKKQAQIMGDMPLLVRKATTDDEKKYESLKAKELPTMYRAREMAKELKLEMKLSDVEYQWDGKKVTFYYSAEDRVDFRELIKRLAAEFKCRVEMKQISLRQEAGRLGGIGVCGRELCCSTWLTDFKAVNTSAARYQNLSLNPQKLSGQCGRLKCCLNYELDTYTEQLKDIPIVDKPIHTQIGEARLQKTDIFKKIMWFSFGNDAAWVSVSVREVTQLLELNKNGIKPNSLNPNDLGTNVEVKTLNKDLKKFDEKLRNKHFKKRPPNKK